MVLSTSSPRTLRVLYLVGLVLLGGCTRRSFSPGPGLQPAFDVPKLLGRNVDEATRRLGPATQPEPDPTPAEVRAQGNTWHRTFRRDTVTLVVTYHVQTRKIFHVFLSTPHATTASYVQLRQLGHLTGQESRLLIEPRLDVAGAWSQRGLWVSRRGRRQP